MQIKRDNYEINRVKKWAEDGRPVWVPFWSGDDVGDYDTGYAEGVADTLAWLEGETDKAPDER